MKPVILHRQRQYEMEQAVKDLESRGYKVIYGPEIKTRDGKSFSRDDYGRRVFQRNTFSSCWVAKLVKV